MLATVQLAITQEALKRYRILAYEHFKNKNITVHVIQLVDESFGVRIMSDSQEKWFGTNNEYNSQESADQIIGWKEKNEAYTELENKILPNIGYEVHQVCMKLFHQNMI